MKFLQANSQLSHLTARTRWIVVVCLLILAAHTVTGVLLFRDGPGFTPSSIRLHYAGSDRAEDLAYPKTYRELLELTHAHLLAGSVILLLVAHLFVMTPFPKTAKTLLIALTFFCFLLDVAGSWLAWRFGSWAAWSKLIGFGGLTMGMSCMIAATEFTLVLSLTRGARRHR